MERDFKLEVILTATTETSYVDDFNQFFDLVWFVFDDTFINNTGLLTISKTLKTHLLGLYPQLTGVKFCALDGMDFSTWMEIQKMKYGETLPVCPIGQTLEHNKQKIR